MGKISQWWQKWTGFARRHHEQANVQTYAANSLLLWAKATFQDNFVLVPNNAHTTQTTRVFLENQDVKALDWPSKNPSMNSIEHLRDLMAVHIGDIDNPPTMATQSWVA